MNCNDSTPSSASLDLSDIGIQNIEDAEEAVEGRSKSNAPITPVSSSKKRKQQRNNLETNAVEALNFAKNYLSSKEKKTLSKEEEFCRYLCSELKEIKRDKTFRAVKMEILQLVQSKIYEEMQIIEQENSQNKFYLTIPQTTTTPASEPLSFFQFPICKPTLSSIPSHFTKPVSTLTSSSSLSCSNFPESSNIIQYQSSEPQFIQYPKRTSTPSSNPSSSYSPIEQSYFNFVQSSEPQFIQYPKRTSTPSSNLSSPYSPSPIEQLNSNTILSQSQFSPYSQSECEEQYYTHSEPEENPPKKTNINIIDVQIIKPAPLPSKKDVLRLSMSGCFENDEIE